MPHIHTEPGQHDMTAAAYIVRVDGDEPRVLVHMHRRFNKLLQIGGHIELNETPWQTIAHELREEGGYTLEELQVLQPDDQLIPAPGAVQHPVPVIMNTHKVPGEHFHSDMCFAFIADVAPANKPLEGESEDLRWLTLAELKDAVRQDLAPEDVLLFYEAILSRYVPNYHRIPAATYSLGKPDATML